MIRLYYWIALLTLGILAQEQQNKNEISPKLLECYTNTYLREKDNKLPHTLNTLIALIQKVEDQKDLNMDLRSLTVTIMHKYRKDGVVENPRVIKKPGVEPYIIDSLQSEKFSRILELIPEITSQLPYDIISDVETCSLHSMLSSSIELYERSDKDTMCKYAENAYRSARSVTSNHHRSTNSTSVNDDVETLTPEQIDVIKHQKDEDVENPDDDPNALYPELPPNHPEVARTAKIAMPPKSRCPVENGVIKTPWGAVSAGSLISGIAAGLQPQIVKVSDILLDKTPEERERLLGISLDNRWFATVAGDLAVAAVRQGPTEEKVSVGVSGNWNSSVPHWYFLSANKKLHFTTAQIRGDLDGLILAIQIEYLYEKIPTLKLSQILDLYYSSHGLFNPSIRACNRRKLFLEIAQNSTEQAHNASFVLKNLHEAVINVEASKAFAAQAATELIQYVRSSMDKDLSCNDTEKSIYNDDVQIAVDLTIILDTTWPFHEIYQIVVNILDNVKINRYNSQFTLINGRDTNIMLNTTSSILDIGSYNITHYRNVTNNSSGFDFPRSLEKLINLQRKKLNDERSGFGHGKSDVVLFIPYTSIVADNDKDFCLDKLKTMREQVPDTTILILAHGSKDTWMDFVKDIETDLFTINNVDDVSAINGVISRIKQVPQRLINTQCGADYNSQGSTNSFIDYIEPGTVIFYKLHPNYFFSTDSDHISKVKIEGSGWGSLNVCTSRIGAINSKSTGDASCTSVNTNTHIIEVSCGDADFIHNCEPLYVSVTANSSITSFQCTDKTLCRFPHMIKYTVSYEGLVCTSSASKTMLSVVVLIASIIYIFL